MDQGMRNRTVVGKHGHDESWLQVLDSGGFGFTSNIFTATVFDGNTAVDLVTQLGEKDIKAYTESLAVACKRYEASILNEGYPLKNTEGLA